MERVYVIHLGSLHNTKRYTDNATPVLTNDKLIVNTLVNGKEQRVETVLRMVNNNILDSLKIVLKVRPDQKIVIITVIGTRPVHVALMANNGRREKP
tara:strand:+ start:1040 stop:1330 length:291 start_codon:yes stop_codon:yes gene_type:complete